MRDVETESRTPFTKTYAAPEVVRQEKRGFGADIFSLGCVFLEMLAILCTPMQRQTLIEIRKTNPEGDWSYQANVRTVLGCVAFCDATFIDDRCHMWLGEATRMVSLDPLFRSSAKSLQEVFGSGQDCCFQGSEPFEAADDLVQLASPSQT